MDQNEKDSGNKLEAGQGPSAKEICSWVDIDDTKRGRWVENGLLSYFGEAGADQDAVVEIFVVKQIVDKIGADDGLVAWRNIRDQVLRGSDEDEAPRAANEPPSRLDLVWLSTPPAVHLVRTDSELSDVVRAQPRRAVVFQLAPVIRQALSTLDAFMKARHDADVAKAQAETRRQHATRGRKPKSAG
jgi:hypothetical protein